MRTLGIALAIGALLAVGCAPAASQPQRDSRGLVRVRSWRPGNLFAHDTLSIDDYDDIWLAEVGIQYSDGQDPLPEPDERSLRKLVYDIALAELPTATRLGARQAGACTLAMGVHLADITLPKPGFAGPRNRGSALVILELKDSQSDEALVRYGQRRELGSRGRKVEAALDLEHLEEPLHDALHDVGSAMRAGLRVKVTGARAAQGCKGAIGDAREQIRGAL